MLFILLLTLSNIHNFDAEIMFWIHDHLQNNITNQIIPYLRKPTFWIWLYVIIIIKMIQWWKTRFFIPLLFLLGTVGIADLASVHLFKNRFERLRPCHYYKEDVRLKPLIPCGGQYGFVSSHATNHMAIGLFMYLLLGSNRKYRLGWILWAIIIGFAQVFVGVHYPFDVLCGFLLGGLIAWIGYSLLKKFFPQYALIPE